MLGFRGASRYAHPAYAEGFALECEALRRVRDDMGLTNLRIMVPFCRRVAEAKTVLDAMVSHGLERGRNGLEIFVMCEIPNNVIQVDAFAAVFDGFSIGSNDLTQLTLGVDRDSEVVAFDFDESDPGMLEMLRLAIAGAKRNHRHVGICGEAPATYPEIARYLVGLGIDSISVNPSSLVRTIEVVQEAERMKAESEHDAARQVQELVRQLRDQGHHDAADRLEHHSTVRDVERGFLFVLREACETFLTAIEAIDPVSQTMIEELRLSVENRLRLAEDKPKPTPN